MSNDKKVWDLAAEQISDPQFRKNATLKHTAGIIASACYEYGGHLRIELEEAICSSEKHFHEAEQFRAKWEASNRQIHQARMILSQLDQWQLEIVPVFNDEMFRARHVRGLIKEALDALAVVGGDIGGSNPERVNDPASVPYPTGKPMIQTGGDIKRSHCCGATVHVDGSHEGTNCYVCDKCSNVCDLEIDAEGDP